MKWACALLLIVQLASCARREPPPTLAVTPPAAATTAQLPATVPPAANTSAPSAPLPSAAAAAPAPTNVDNRDGLRGLLGVLPDIERVELLRWNVAVAAQPLSEADQTRLVQLLRNGQLTDTHTVAHPPWPAALLFHTRKSGTYAVTLVGHSSLRLDAARADGRFEGAAARWNSAPAPEMALSDEDGWLWHYFEARLGPTREKEYLMHKAPAYLELPQKP